MTTPALTRTLTAIGRQMPVHCIAINDHIPAGTIAILAHWDDILAHLLTNVRNATLHTRFELDRFHHQNTGRTLFDDTETLP